MFFCPWMWSFRAMFCHTGPNSSVVFAGCQILRNTDLQIPILKNEQQLKLKVHKLWTTALWVIQDCSDFKQWFLNSGLFFLNIMWLFGLKCIVPPLVITFQLPYSQYLPSSHAFLEGWDESNVTWVGGGGGWGQWWG